MEVLHLCQYHSHLLLLYQIYPALDLCPLLCMLYTDREQDIFVVEALNWESNFVQDYHRLLPAQRLAIAWTLTKEGTDLSLNFPDGDLSQISPVELMLYVSPKMFKVIF